MQNDLLRKVQNVEFEILKEVAKVAEKNDIEYYLGWGTLIGCIRHKGFIPWDDDIDIVAPRIAYVKLVKALKKELPELYWVQDYDSDESYWLPYAKVRKKGTLYREYGQKHIPDEKCGIWIDIFPLEYYSGGKLKAAITNYLLITNMYSLKRKYLNMRFAEFSRRYIPAMIFWSFLTQSSRKKMQNVILKIGTQKKGEYLVDLVASIDLRRSMFPQEYFAESIRGDFEGESFSIPKGYHEILTQCYGDYMTFPPEDQRRGHNIIDKKNIKVDDTTN